MLSFSVVKRKSGESLESVGVIEKFWQADLDEVQIIFTPLAKSSYRYVLSTLICANMDTQ